ncbi:PREDICTED: tomoregulin-1 [Calidris pugnax]|uniref:tomoregulin-1 n=1 Tax=Calidris pugnax TaxID=198806 RepID=UPI00071DEE56|nr:PREDICTED: tomoregulin-1 [Calidris pugnax]
MAAGPGRQGEGWKLGPVGLLRLSKSQQWRKEDACDARPCMCLENVIDVAEESMLSRALMSLKTKARFPAYRHLWQRKAALFRENELITKAVDGEYWMGSSPRKCLLITASQFSEQRTGAGALVDWEHGCGQCYPGEQLGRLRVFAPFELGDNAVCLAEEKAWQSCCEVDSQCPFIGKAGTARESAAAIRKQFNMRKVADRFDSPDSEVVPYVDMTISFSAIRPICRLQFCDIVTFWLRAAELNVRESDVKVCDESSCKYGGVCKEEGDGLKCACQFQCHTNYIPVCGSNGDTYQNECFLRRASCKHQKEITVVSRGPCYSDNGSGSGEGEYEGSGTEVQRKHSKCGVCKYRAECDEDAENVGCVCNIDCSGYSFNPVCASDGSSYNNPCFVREASCLRQEQIDIRHLGHCSDTDDANAVGKKDDGMQYRPEVKDASDQREDIYIGNHIPCSESFNGYCIHGKCEFIYSTQKASCRCESGYTGQHCEKTDFSILYVVPSRQKLTHVLIAAIIGAVQIAIIVAIVMCITRKCPKNNRGRRQKQNLGHFTSDTSSRMV